MIQFDYIYNILQMGWNHQPVYIYIYVPLYKYLNDPTINTAWVFWMLTQGATSPADA